MELLEVTYRNTSHQNQSICLHQHLFVDSQPKYEYLVSEIKHEYSIPETAQFHFAPAHKNGGSKMKKYNILKENCFI